MRDGDEELAPITSFSATPDFLNIDSLTAAELERRLELAIGLSVLTCGVDNCAVYDDVRCNGCGTNNCATYDCKPPGL